MNSYHPSDPDADNPIQQLIEVQRQQAEAFQLQHSINQQMGRQIERLVVAITALYKIQGRQLNLLAALAARTDDPQVADLLREFQNVAMTELTTLAQVLTGTDEAG